MNTTPHGCKYASCGRARMRMRKRAAVAEPSAPRQQSYSHKTFIRCITFAPLRAPLYNVVSSSHVYLPSWMVRKKSMHVVNTTNKIPPPGPNLNTLGMKPLYNAAKPSSLATVTNSGNVQTYRVSPA